jgi:hypothetical protein
MKPESTIATFCSALRKRNQLVELWEVEKYGRDCFSDPDHVHLYGLPPKAWYERGVRILARTCLEAVKDPLGNKIGRDIAEVVLPSVGNRAVGVVDPFAGSCNSLYAILRHLPGARGIGFEVEPAFMTSTPLCFSMVFFSALAAMVVVSEPWRIDPQKN